MLRSTRGEGSSRGDTPGPQEFSLSIEQKNRLKAEAAISTYAASSGPGGQNVNKVATAAELRWNLEESGIFSEEEKEKIRSEAGNRLNNAGEIIFRSKTHKSATANKRAVENNFYKLLEDALAPETERIETRPSRAAKERRVEEKKRRGQKKQSRGRITDYD